MTRPTVAVWKFASCDGCQLTVLDCEDELLAIAEALDIRMFLEAGPDELLDHYDLSLVEGSITTAHDAERIRDVRDRSGLLVTLGACATAGGIQALRNSADVDEYRRVVYARPEWIDVLSTSTPIAHHVAVDHELHGCPISKHELLATIAALLARRRPPVTGHSVCIECKRRGTPCLLVTEGAACLGPVTRAGCDALCPSIGRGCFGCFGPSEAADVTAHAGVLVRAGHPPAEVARSLRTFNVLDFVTEDAP
jgi:sulfhydrogenase subunit delta